MDFWVNLSFLAGSSVAGYFALVAIAGRYSVVWYPFVAAAVAHIAYRMACKQARTWGIWLRSAYDLYLGDLAKQMGFAYPKEIRDQRTLWSKWWQAAYYVNSDTLAELDYFRVAGK